MVSVGLVTDCSEPAATKYAIGHGVSSLRARDLAGLRIQLIGCNVGAGLDVPGPLPVRADDVFTVQSTSIPHTG